MAHCPPVAAPHPVPLRRHPSGVHARRPLRARRHLIVQSSKISTLTQRAIGEDVRAEIARTAQR
jgi:hypothetical protein